MLSDRRQRILCALIEEYVANALPVGSRTITERYQLGVSPATVRNELSALEGEGYITQPHTSAGRIPTDAGYREFVDNLIASGITSGMNPYEPVLMQLRQTASALDDLLEKTSAEMAKLTDCLSIVTAPAVVLSKIRQVSLVSLSNRQALIIVVGQDGQVVNESITFSEDVPMDRIISAESRLQSLLQGHSLAEIASDSSVHVHESLPDPISREIFDVIVSKLKESGFSKTSRMGISSLMKKPEFHDSADLLPIMEILEDDTVLFSSFDIAGNAQSDVMIRIGQENGTEGLSGVSVVAGTYGIGDSKGVVAVIGPKRMNYTRVIEAVRAAQDALGQD